MILRHRSGKADKQIEFSSANFANSLRALRGFITAEFAEKFRRERREQLCSLHDCNLVGLQFESPVVRLAVENGLEFAGKGHFLRLR